MKKILLLFLAAAAAPTLVKAQGHPAPTQLYAPANNAVINLNGDPNQTITFEWSKPVFDWTTTVQYETLLRIVEKDSSWNNSFNTLSDDMGDDSSATFTYEQLALTFPELKAGQSRTYHWMVNTSAYYLTDTTDSTSGSWRPILSADTFSFTVNRGVFDNELNPFNLITPANPSSYTVQGDPAGTLDFTWHGTDCPNGGCSPQYTLLIDTIGGNMEYPIQFYATNSSDTSFSLTNNQLAGVCTLAGIPKGGSKTVLWSVLADDGTSIAYAGTPHQITLTRSMLDNENTPFYCLSPTNNTSIKLQGDTVTAFTFNWTSSKLGLSSGQYTLKMALQSGSLSSPDITQVTGLDTFWNTSFGSLMNRMDAAYGNTWDTLRLQWTAQVNFSGPTFDADNIHQLTLVRGYFYANGIEENNSPKIIAYPQPAKDITFITGLPAQAVWQLYNMNGSLLFENKIPANNSLLSINTASLSSGMYILVYQTHEIHGNVKVFIEK